MINLKKEEEYEFLKNELITAFVNRKCYKCGSKTKKMKEGNLLVCSFFACKTKFSYFKNTIFENSKLPVITTIKILDMFLECVPFDLITNISGVSRASVSFICSKLRNLKALDLYLKNYVKIGGQGRIVEIDESKFGKRKYNKGHKVDGVWVICAVERSSRRIILQHVVKRDAETLTSFCNQYINLKSTIFSDCWRGYSRLINFFQEHRTVNHSKEFVNRQSNVHTNTIEGNWNGIKKTIPVRDRTISLIDIFLFRFMLKRNEKENNLKYCLKLLNSFD